MKIEEKLFKIKTTVTSVGEMEDEILAESSEKAIEELKETSGRRGGQFKVVSRITEYTQA